MKRRAAVPDRAALAEEIATLPKADIKNLRDRWRLVWQSSVGADRPVLFGARDRLPAPEQAFGGLKPATRRLLARIADDGCHHEFTEATTAAKGSNRNDPGPRMARERPPGHGAE